MKTNDLVSIIIPCYNQAQYLKEAVKSAIEQTYENIEIIIINDGSSDNTEEIALNLQEKYPETIEVISQKNSGVSEARNNAIKQSKGKYILPLDGDDIIGKSMISSCLKSMIENNADIVYVDTQCFGIKDYLIKKLPFSQNNFLYENLCNATSLYKKEIWEKLGGYAKNMKEGYEDWEFWIHAFKKGYKFQLLSEPLLIYRTQEVSRNTKATVKDAYLRAIISLNHPELYTIEDIQKATSLIKEAELQADLYFYGTEDLSIDEKYLIKAISLYLSSDKLQEKQLIDIPSNTKKFGLYELDLLENSTNLKQLCEEVGVDFILFYSSVRYETPSFQSLSFAWEKEKGIIDVHGTIFPFVLKSKREDYGSQLIAYKRLVRYQDGKIKNDEALIQGKNKVIEEQKNSIKEKAELLQKKNKVIKNTKSKNETIMQSIHKVVSCPLKKCPIQKYKAYKTLMKDYFKLQKVKNESH